MGGEAQGSGSCRKTARREAGSWPSPDECSRQKKDRRGAESKMGRAQEGGSQKSASQESASREEGGSPDRTGGITGIIEWSSTAVAALSSGREMSIREAA
jgi:hypothetical protein